MAVFQWVRVSNRWPCPVCKAPDWCSVSADGAVSKCMRVAEGCFRSKQDKDGGHYYLHRLLEGPGAAPQPPPCPGAEAGRADAKTLHSVYSALLSRLVLTEAHKEALRRRGLGDESVERGSYRTLPVQGRARIARDLRERFGDDLLRVPGFVVKEGLAGRYLTLRGPAGLLVPCRGPGGSIVALKVRRDGAGEGPRYVYLSSAGHGGPGSGAPVHLPAGTPEAAELFRITEGELKADVARALDGLPTVSVPGVGSWRPALAVLKGLGCKTVRLSFDADSRHKPSVARCLAACADALTKAGFALELERWDPADGKGIDDLLAAGKTPGVLRGHSAIDAVQDALAAAGADKDPAPTDELARLQNVLAAGGAVALFSDKPLLQALANLAAGDPAAFAAARASIRERVSLRELDRVLGPLRRQAEAGAGENVPLYFEQGGCICRNVQTKEGPLSVALCNFTGRIVEDVVHDDGTEQARALAVQGTLADGSLLERVEVPAAEFAGMGWVMPKWGTRAVVSAGQGTKDHLRAALQLLSGNVPRHTVFTHTGWRQVGGAWVYLHAAGGIGAGGAIDVPVALPPALAGYALPVPLAAVPADVVPAYGRLGEAARREASELADAVRASLGLVGLGPDHLTVPLLAAVYRAALGDTDFALHLAGPTGTYKSEAAALAQQHYGAGMDARHLPASWSSTGNALEGLAFAAKDALLCVDDFCPVGSSADVQRYHKEADRLFRGQGNHAGRQRMRCDGSLRPGKPPRGLTLSTGEDVPRGQSLRARVMVLEVSPGDFGPLPPHPNPALSARQRDAADGKYAVAMAGFLRWLSPQYDAVRGRLRGELADLRDRAGSDGQHARTPSLVADLALGLRYLLDFAVCAGAISDLERGEWWERGWSALAGAGAAQAAHISGGEPAAMFVRLLSAALVSGHAHVAGKDGDEPEEPSRWGWLPEEFHTRDGVGTRYRPQGIRVGWLVEGNLYLEPEVSYTAVQTFARDQGECFPVTGNTLRRRLKERDLLVTTDGARGKLTVRKTLQGERREVLHIAWDGAAPAENSGGSSEGAGARPGPDGWAGTAGGDGEPARESPYPPAGGDALGRMGRSGTGGEAGPGAVSASEQEAAWGEWQ